MRRDVRARLEERPSGTPTPRSRRLSAFPNRLTDALSALYLGARHNHDAAPLRPFMRTFIALALVLLAWVGPLHASPEGTVTWGAHVSLAPPRPHPPPPQAPFLPLIFLYPLHTPLSNPLHSPTP